VQLPANLQSFKVGAGLHAEQHPTENGVATDPAGVQVVQAAFVTVVILDIDMMRE
jgi:hypothetical protein